MDGTGQPYDPVEYATRFIQYYQLMKAADPTIKIGAVASPGEDDYPAASDPGVTNPRTHVVHHGWTPEVLNTLKAGGVTPDFLIFHNYPAVQGVENDANELQISSVGVLTNPPLLPWTSYAAAFRQQLSDYLPATGGSVELCCTETNTGGEGKQSTSLVSGLYMADSVGSILQTEFNSMLWWDAFNGPTTTGNLSSTLYGWRQYGDSGLMVSYGAAYPTYYVHKLMSYFARGGDTVVKASSTSSLLSVYSVRRQDASLSVMVINKDPLNSWTGTFAISGFSPQPTAAVYSYGIPQDNAENPNSSSYGASPDIAQSRLTDASSSLSYSFSPYSVTVLSLAPPAPVITANPADEVVDSGSTLVLTAAASDAASYQWSFTPRGSSAAQPVVDGSATGSDVVSGSSGPQLVISDATSLSAGAYTVVAVNPTGSSQPGAAATVTVVTSPTPGTVGSISARSFVGTGDNILIGGFYINGSTSATVLIQAIGPALSAAPYNVAGTLKYPSLSIHQTQNGKDVTLYSNAGWGTSPVLAAAANAAYAQPALQPGSADSELLLTLPPGGYTAEVAGADGGTGVALCAIYQLP